MLARLAWSRDGLTCRTRWIESRPYDALARVDEPTQREPRGWTARSTPWAHVFSVALLHWTLSWRADPRARRLADRHYNRQSVGHPNFMPPGRCLVLVTAEADAFWGTSWPFAEFVRHAWGGAWMCSAFRNEGPARASMLIREAVAATRAVYGEPPALGMVTFVDPSEVRAKANPGHTFVMAGFRPICRCHHVEGEHRNLWCLGWHFGHPCACRGFDNTTMGGLLAFGMKPERMPAPAEPINFARRLFT